MASDRDLDQIRHIIDLLRSDLAKLAKAVAEIADGAGASPSSAASARRVWRDNR